MAANQNPKQRVYLDLTHLGRHVTGIERISIELFEKVAFEDAEVIAVRSSGVLSMILRQQLLLPVLALMHPRAKFVFPGFPPSPFFCLIRHRVMLYVHDTFLITRRRDLSAKARLYTAPQFRLAVAALKNFLVNSEKTRAELASLTSRDATVQLYRPSVSNIFGLAAHGRDERPATPRPLRLVTLGTIEPRKNYAAALNILDSLRTMGFPDAELHIIGRAGWGNDAERVSAHPQTIVHGYLEPTEVKRCLEDADVYLCTSHDEGLGLPLLEAQYAGLPVAAPDQPVFREVLGTAATFIDPSDAGGAAGAIGRLFATPGWRRNARKAAEANIGRWNANAAVDLESAKKMFSVSPAQLGNAQGMAVRTR